MSNKSELFALFFILWIVSIYINKSPMLKDSACCYGRDYIPFLFVFVIFNNFFLTLYSLALNNSWLLASFSFWRRERDYCQIVMEKIPSRGVNLRQIIIEIFLSCYCSGNCWQFLTPSYLHLYHNQCVNLLFSM